MSGKFRNLRPGYDPFRPSDLAQIRDSLFQSANELKACADKMAKESQHELAQLQQEVEQYQTRLEDAEKLAGSDG